MKQFISAQKTEHIKDRREEGKKNIFTEHHYHCHWAASLKSKKRSKESGVMASGGGNSPWWEGEGQTLSSSSSSSPLAYSEPSLGFEADSKLHVLILAVPVAHLDKRHLFLLFLLVLKNNQQLVPIYWSITTVTAFIIKPYSSGFIAPCCHPDINSVKFRQKHS